jgi:predicted amidohydrolase
LGRSWVYDCKGGCVLFDAGGNVLAKANRKGEEEVLYCTLTIPAANESRPETFGTE